MTKINDSFSAANVEIPAKIFQHPAVVTRGIISPVHLQWMPTNRCDQKCSFCSCADRNKFDSLDISKSREAIETFAGLGAKAITITGGGEPMLYPHISELIGVFVKNGIEVGIVTNGLAYKTWDFHALRAARWLRMSISDEYPMETIDEKIEAIAGNLAGVDVALSYVVTESMDVDKMRAALNAINRFGLTHIRFVLDILNVDSITPDFDRIFDGLDVSRAIIQRRTSYEPGAGECLLSLAKPVIGADGNVYPCCGVQYARAGGNRELGRDFIMGGLDDVYDLWTQQAYYDGSRCDKCYYGGQNRALAALRSNVRHANFI